jgi:hypothetical protein
MLVLHPRIRMRRAITVGVMVGVNVLVEVGTSVMVGKNVGVLVAVINTGVRVAFPPPIGVGL